MEYLKDLYKKNYDDFYNVIYKDTRIADHRSKIGHYKYVSNSMQRKLLICFL